MNYLIVRLEQTSFPLAMPKASLVHPKHLIPLVGELTEIESELPCIGSVSMDIEYCGLVLDSLWHGHIVSHQFNTLPVRVSD